MNRCLPYIEPKDKGRQGEKSEHSAKNVADQRFTFHCALLLFLGLFDDVLHGLILVCVDDDVIVGAFQAPTIGAYPSVSRGTQSNR